MYIATPKYICIYIYYYLVPLNDMWILRN